MSFPNLFQLVRVKEPRVGDYLERRGEQINWNPVFIREMHDWKLEEVGNCMDQLYSMKLADDLADRMVWKPAQRGLFEMKSFYSVLVLRGDFFTWKSIWKVKADMAFFVGHQLLGRF